MAMTVTAGPAATSRPEPGTDTIAAIANATTHDTQMRVFMMSSPARDRPGHQGMARACREE